VGRGEGRGGVSDWRQIELLRLAAGRPAAVADADQGVGAELLGAVAEALLGEEVDAQLLLGGAHAWRGRQAGGAFGALLLTQNMLSLPALIGLLMLIGVATKNSILLVDYAVMAEDEHGLSQHDALVDACRKRARPVIMTTLAMGAGMLPLALGLSGDSSFRAPMAWAVIGGLGISGGARRARWSS